MYVTRREDNANRALAGRFYAPPQKANDNDVIPNALPKNISSFLYTSCYFLAEYISMLSHWFGNFDLGWPLQGK